MVHLFLTFPSDRDTPICGVVADIPLGKAFLKHDYKVPSGEIKISFFGKAITLDLDEGSGDEFYIKNRMVTDLSFTVEDLSLSIENLIRIWSKSHARKKSRNSSYHKENASTL